MTEVYPYPPNAQISPQEQQAMGKLWKLTPVPWNQVQVADGFWGRRAQTNRAVTLPLEYQINKKNGVLDAYQWDWWDKSKGNPPWKIWVGDLGKWIEAASYSLGTHPDAEVARLVDDAAAHIIAGQKEDGYIYCNPLTREWRWARLEFWHQFYDAGHTIEGAVARYRATGQRDLLDAMCRYADLIDANFGPEPGKKRGYDGHQEIELALVKLYRATGVERYLKLAKFFLDSRGTEPNYFQEERAVAAKLGLPAPPWAPVALTHYQAHQPVREQQDAVGHAVRALYMYSGMADVAAETGDAELLAACRRMWKSIVQRRMYVIGGVGSSQNGEKFTFDYDLPNETAYAETCANISLVFFAQRMLQIDADGEYADVMERALYNGVVSGVSLDGQKFFYANHLAAYPDPQAKVGEEMAWSRRGWFGCACCPPNIARLIASIGGYAYSVAEKKLYVHLYLGGSVQTVVDGQKVLLRQETEYPWKEQVKLTVEPEQPAEFALMLRVPGWCRRAQLRVNGKAVNLKRGAQKGYAQVRRRWVKGDVVELMLPMPVERIEARPQVRMDCGKVALQRGPIVYCLEEVDNGKDLCDLTLPRGSKLSVRFDSKLGGAAVITGKALRRDAGGWDGTLYRPVASKRKTVAIRAVPYALWNNRGDGEMLVWIREA
jgi:DUF1680 family protein